MQVLEEKMSLLDRELISMIIDRPLRNEGVPEHLIEPVTQYLDSFVDGNISEYLEALEADSG